MKLVMDMTDVILQRMIEQIKINITIEINIMIEINTILTTEIIIEIVKQLQLLPMKLMLQTMNNKRHQM
jgi:hypothetical protein